MGALHTTHNNRDVCGPKTTVLVGNEERDASLQAFFVEELQRRFIVKPVKRKKLCELPGFHDLVQVWVCKLRRAKKQQQGDGDEQQEREDAEEEDEQDG